MYLGTCVEHYKNGDLTYAQKIGKLAEMGFKYLNGCNKRDLEVGNLMLALWMVPVIPIGVGIGYGLVRILREKYYVGLIYGALIVTSGMLIHRAFAG